MKLTVKCPRVASGYNNHMGGVDKHDMLRQIYGIDRKSVKINGGTDYFLVYLTWQ